MKQRNRSETSGNLEYARRIVEQVCNLAGSLDYLTRCRAEIQRHGLTERNSPCAAMLYDWLINIVSYQGISDQAAAGFIREHGQAKWGEIETKLATASCDKLRSFWHFKDCNYVKSKKTCSRPKLCKSCPLPSHNLRNGRLNQAAYSLFFFMRDVAGGDFFNWIDRQLPRSSKVEDESIGERLIGPMRSIHGLSDKVLSMALSTLLIGRSRRNSMWFKAGCRMIVVDSLVHNFLHRTGILKRFQIDHLYGVECFRENKCTGLLSQISREIDAQRFNATYPSFFPRFVQNAIWRYCALSEFNECNGVRIDDRHRCNNRACRLYAGCDRRRLGRGRLAK